MRRPATLALLGALAGGVLLSGCATRARQAPLTVESSPEAQRLAGGPLPAAFSGLLPCADCPGIRWTLDLFPDGVFFQRLEYLEATETGGTAVFDEIGRWVLSPDGAVLVLGGGQEAPQFFAPRAGGTLRKLDGEAREIESGLNYDLRRTDPFVALEPRLTLSGLYSYYADADLFRDCLTGLKLPVAWEADRLALERAYLAARPEPGQELMAVVEGRLASRPAMEDGRFVTTLVVEKFLRLEPDAACPPPFAALPLEGPDWRAVRVGDRAVAAEARQGPRAPGLRFDAATKRFGGSGGCNRLTGTYELDGPALRFGVVAATRMACPDMEAEKAFVQALEATARHRVLGGMLELYDAEGALLVRFEGHAGG